MCQYILFCPHLGSHPCRCGDSDSDYTTGQSISNKSDKTVWNSSVLPHQINCIGDLLPYSPQHRSREAQEVLGNHTGPKTSHISENQSPFLSKMKLMLSQICINHLKLPEQIRALPCRGVLHRQAGLS